MWEIISSFFQMIWALFGVILQLALPCFVVFIIILIIGRLAQPTIRHISALMFGINPRSYNDEFNRAKYGTAHPTRQDKERVRKRNEHNEIR